MQPWTTWRPCATFVCGLCGCKCRFVLLWLVLLWLVLLWLVLLWLVARVGCLVLLAGLVLRATKTWHV